MLVPILLLAHGRSGTRAMMSLLGTDPAVTFDRVNDFQNRQLTYLAKLSILVDRRVPAADFPEIQMRDLDDSTFGPPPWPPGGFLLSSTNMRSGNMDLFPVLWEVASRKIPKSQSVRFYAEKSPPWVSTFVAPHVAPFNIYLFRDPRDVFISAMAYMRKRNNLVGFGRHLNDSDESFVRVLCCKWIGFYEHWRMSGPDPRTLMFRYEDFVQRPEDAALKINEMTGLNLKAGAIEEGLHHRTAQTTADSIFRHRTGIFSPELLNLFAEYLSDEMAVLGYDPGPPAKFKRALFQDFPRTSNGDGQLIPTSDRAIVEITGPDFHFSLRNDPVQADDINALWLSAKAALGDHCTVYWRRDGESFSEERAVQCHYFPGTHWRVLDFQLSNHPLWTGTIAELRLDLFNTLGQVVPGTCEVAWYRLIGQK
jgi:Sulfotransferase domain